MSDVSKGIEKTTKTLESDVKGSKNRSSSEQESHYKGHRQRLRERFLNSARNSLPDYELLEIILFATNPRSDVKPIAKRLLKEFKNFAQILNASQRDLMKVEGMNISSVSALYASREAAERLLKSEIDKKSVLQSWNSVVNYCRLTMGYLKQEQFRILFLDKQNQLIADELQEEGTIDKVHIYPRKVVKRVLELEASSIVLVHNHPSGSLIPSKADIDITIEIIKAVSVIGVTVHDHMIISHSSHYSFKNHKLI